MAVALQESVVETVAWALVLQLSEAEIVAMWLALKIVLDTEGRNDSNNFDGGSGLAALTQGAGMGRGTAAGGDRRAERVAVSSDDWGC